MVGAQRMVGNSRQSGASLIEIMVSVFVFSIGALGLAALQTQTLVRADDSKQRSVVLWKAEELVSRIRASKTLENPAGLGEKYYTTLNKNNSGGTIGKFDSSDAYSCPAAAPKKCDVINASCSEDEVVTFDLWSILCDPSTGLIPSAPSTGSVGLTELEVALVQDVISAAIPAVPATATTPASPAVPADVEYRLFFEWINRNAFNNKDDDGADTGLQRSTGAQATTKTLLCGTSMDVDTRLDTYCVRFK